MSFSGNERNCCFLNTGDGKFATVSAVSGVDFPDDARGMSTVDWDHDGDLDLIQTCRSAPQVRIFRNDSTANNQFLDFKLIGTRSNRDAIGARVELYRAGASCPLIKSVRAGSGFLSQSSKWVHFGIGTSNGIEKAVVRWPSGLVEEFHGIIPNSRYEITEGSEKLKTWEPLERKVELVSRDFKPVPRQSSTRTVCSAHVYLPELPYQSFRTGWTTVAETSQNRPVLVNLWASWCSTCVGELLEFENRSDELRKSGLDVIAICVDGLGDDGSNSEKARKFAIGKGLSFETGVASEDLLDKLQILRGELFKRAQAFPLPTSFLIDGDGRLIAIYEGSVDLDTLLDDILIVNADANELRDYGVPIAGRWFTSPQKVNYAMMAHVFRDTGYESDASFFDSKAEIQKAGLVHNEGLERLAKGRVQEAIACFQNAIEKDPNYASAYQYLGLCQMQIAKLDDAERNLRHSIHLDSSLKDAYLGLGRIHVLRKDLSEARLSYAAVVELDTQCATAHAALGYVHRELGDCDAAQACYEAAIEIDPNQVSWLCDLGKCFVAQNRYGKATSLFRKAVEIAPEQTGIQLCLAQTLASALTFDEALQCYRCVIEQDPENKDALLNLAWYLSTLPDGELRNGSEAVELAERLTSRKNRARQPRSLDVLAAAYAEAGEFDLAIKTAEKAMEYAEKRREFDLKEEINSRRKLYSMNRPYRVAF